MWFNPSSLQQALELKHTYGGTLQPIAGGTDLMVAIRTGLTDRPPALLNLNGIAELSGIRCEAGGVTIGAATPFARIRRAAVVRDRLPMLAASGAVTGALPIQNRATLGGNIMNASPAADTPPALLSYGAQLILSSTQGERRLAYARFHCGYRRTLCEPDELLRAVYIPYPNNAAAVHYYRKVGTRSAQSISKVTLAALMDWREGRLAHSAFGLASVAAMPVAAPTLSAYLSGKTRETIDVQALREALAQDIHPRDDIRSSADYRRHIAGNLVLEALSSSVSQPSFKPTIE